LLDTRAVACARIENEALMLEDFREDDPVVVSLMEGQEDLEETTHRCLQIGARALQDTQVRIDTEEMRRSIERLTLDLEERMRGGTDQLAGALSSALGEGPDSALAQVMAGFEVRLGERLAAVFDPDSKKSALGLVEELLAEGRRAQAEALRRTLDPSDQASPLARHQAHILHAVRAEAEQVRRAVAEVSEKVAVRQAQSELMEKTSIKGASYEDLVHQVVSALVAPLGDVAEQVGRQPGSAGTLRGDEVVTVNPEDSAARSLRYVLEIKDRKMAGTAIDAEIAEAMSNRDTTVAIAVFSAQKNSPVPVPFLASGNKAYVVLDKDEPDPHALRAACMWARWMTRRASGEPTAALQVDAVEQCLADIVRALERSATIRRCHGTAQKKISEAAGQLDGLQDQVESALDRLREVIA
jgi:hypothetical protein